MPSTRSTERPAGPGTSTAQQWAKRMAPVLEEGFPLIPIETWERIRTHLRLSPREFEIALCAAVGRSRKQTAKLLRISPGNRGLPHQKDLSQQHAMGATTEVMNWRAHGVGGTRIGPSQAPVTIVLHLDFPCPYCADQIPVLQLVRSEFPHKIAVVYQHFLGHRSSREAALAAKCAGHQRLFEEYAQRIFREAALSEEERWTDLAEATGTPDIGAFVACVNDDAVARRVDEGFEAALELGVRGAPTYVINDRLRVGALTVEELRSHVRLARKTWRALERQMGDGR
jgi:predicted DsbA family dithiol-disulfide isomerase